MISVFLVEDEFIVREGIKNINWEAHGLSFVGEASDGELAFPLIKKKHPDIVSKQRLPFSKKRVQPHRHFRQSKCTFHETN